MSASLVAAMCQDSKVFHTVAICVNDRSVVKVNVTVIRPGVVSNVRAPQGAFYNDERSYGFSYSVENKRVYHSDGLRTSRTLFLASGFHTNESC